MARPRTANHFSVLTAYQAEAVSQHSDVATVCSDSVFDDCDLETVASANTCDVSQGNSGFLAFQSPRSQTCKNSFFPLEFIELPHMESEATTKTCGSVLERISSDHQCRNQTSLSSVVSSATDECSAVRETLLEGFSQTLPFQVWSSPSSFMEPQDTAETILHSQQSAGNTHFSSINKPQTISGDPSIEFTVPLTLQPSKLKVVEKLQVKIMEDDEKSLEVETSSVGDRSTLSFCGSICSHSTPFDNNKNDEDEEVLQTSIYAMKSHCSDVHVSTSAYGSMGYENGRLSPGGTIYRGSGIRRYQGRFMKLPLKRFREECQALRLSSGDLHFGDESSPTYDKKWQASEHLLLPPHKVARHSHNV
jgi:hypothetical protein